MNSVQIISDAITPVCHICPAGFPDLNEPECLAVNRLNAFLFISYLKQLHHNMFFLNTINVLRISVGNILKHSFFILSGTP